MLHTSARRLRKSQTDKILLIQISFQLICFLLCLTLGRIAVALLLDWDTFLWRFYSLNDSNLNNIKSQTVDKLILIKISFQLVCFPLCLTSGRLAVAFLLDWDTFLRRFYSLNDSNLNSIPLVCNLISKFRYLHPQLTVIFHTVPWYIDSIFTR